MDVQACHLFRGSSKQNHRHRTPNYPHIIKDIHSLAQLLLFGAWEGTSPGKEERMLFQVVTRSIRPSIFAFSSKKDDNRFLLFSFKNCDNRFLLLSFVRKKKVVQLFQVKLFF